MGIQLPVIETAAAALITAALVSLISTPVVRSLAFRMHAVDVPRDNRRMHDHPIPRMGGLAIFFGFLLSVLIFLPLTEQLRTMLLGSVIIVVLGIVDDIKALGPKLKFAVQIVAALVAVSGGNRIEFLSNINIFSSNPYWDLGWLSFPITVLWIAGITNAVNLIDGLDGLACGVSTISSMTLLVIALIVTEPDIAILTAALAGACSGFLPYNLNPAKIFMGDTGSTFLGFILATASVEGLFKFHMIISFAVPFLMLGLPIFDTCFAIVRRISHGQSPLAPDRGHIHHRLIDMGFSQKQAVATLYIISAILGLSAVVLTTAGVLRAMIFLVALCFAGAVAASIFISHNGPHDAPAKKEPAPRPPLQQQTNRPNRLRPQGPSQIAGNENFFGEEDQSSR